MYRSIFLLLLVVFSTKIEAQINRDELNYALIETAAVGNTDSLISILKLDPNIDFRDANSGTALFYATQNNHFDIVQILAFNGANLNYGIDGGFTPLMMACVNGYFEIANYLAQQGANLNDRDDFNATALHYSVAMADYYLVDMLLYYGANPNLLTHEKTSCLLIASMNGDTAVSQLLIDKAADINQKNEYDYSPLSIAVQDNDTLMFDFLIEKGANPKELNIDRYSPHAWALLNENNYAFKKLKPKQIDEQSQKNNRYNCLNLACRNSDMKLVKALKAEGYNNGWLPYYNAINFQFSSAINSGDVFYSFGFGLQDVKYKTDLVLSYGTRFKQKAVWFEESSESYLQLWEHRRYLELYLQKRFVFNLEFINISLYAGLASQWNFGKYDGVRKAINPSIVWIPKIGVRVDMNPVYFIMGYQYCNYKLYDISAHKFDIGLGYQLNFVKKPEKYTLIWME